MKGSKSRKRGQGVACSLCGVGTHMGSEICVKCANRLLEQPWQAVRASGDIPAPYVDEEVVREYLQLSLWATWE